MCFSQKVQTLLVTRKTFGRSSKFYLIICLAISFQQKYLYFQLRFFFIMGQYVWWSHIAIWRDFFLKSWMTFSVCFHFLTRNCLLKEFGTTNNLQSWSLKVTMLWCNYLKNSGFSDLLFSQMSVNICGLNPSLVDTFYLKVIQKLSN